LSLAEKFFIDRRRAGVLLHPTSLPGPQFNGDLGPDAYRFVDWMAQAGLSVWQMLPLNPPPPDGSPYQCQSSFAGNSNLISVIQLIRDGWLPADYVADEIHSPLQLRQALEASFAYFTRQGDAAQKQNFGGFCVREKDWLDDWALFAALKSRYPTSWTEWPHELKKRDADALARIQIQLQDEIDIQRYTQFLFFSQWHKLRDFAAQKNIQLFGDLPIFVSHDSCDVWASPELFNLDEQGQPVTVAGVPPDYFSETGQRWGNPHYNWDRMQQDQFKWWRRRIEVCLALVDILRIDHFRGLEAFWEIPASEATAVAGQWRPAPGQALLASLQKHLNPLPIVAEDLGIITDAVVELRDSFHLPGMKILQFAFGGGPDNPYLPHKHVRNSVVYTGTHDNNTLMGWLNALDDAGRQHAADYLDCHTGDIAQKLIRCTFASVAELAIVPLQDFLLLPESERMNTPGTLSDHNWKWRFKWEQIPYELAGQIHYWSSLYGRLI